MMNHADGESQIERSVVIRHPLAVIGKEVSARASFAGDADGVLADVNAIEGADAVNQKPVNKPNTAAHIKNPGMLRITDEPLQEFENQPHLKGYEDVVILTDPTNALVHDRRILVGELVEAVHSAFRPKVLMDFNNPELSELGQGKYGL
jgi:hypothetical protein